MSANSKCIATVDLGSNSFLLLLARVDASQRTTILKDEIRMPRLGEDVARTGMIQEAALLRAEANLREYRRLMEVEKPDVVCAVTTAAMRLAKNQAEALARLQKALGYPIEVISGEREAELTFASVAAEETLSPLAVIDIGGASTEIAVGEAHGLTHGHSFPIGTVKLLEACFSDGVSPSHVERAKAHVLNILAAHPLENFPAHVLGTAGSFTHLASLALHLGVYHSERVNGFEIGPALVAQWIARCQQLSREELARLPGADPKRIDLLLPGCIIIDALITHFGLKGIHVKDRGVRYGLLFEQLSGRAEKHPSSLLAAPSPTLSQPVSWSRPTLQFISVPSPTSQDWMTQAARLSIENVREGRGGPFAALVVKNGQLIAWGVNQVTALNDATAHAEVQAIRKACQKLGDFQLTGCELYASCEPCPMCLGAIYWSRVDRVYYANTHSDAAAIGFDDQFIYEELAQPVSQRRLSMTQLSRDQALEAFHVWRQSETKIPY